MSQGENSDPTLRPPRSAIGRANGPLAAKGAVLGAIVLSEVLLRLGL